MNDEWRTVIGYNGAYEVSASGIVRTLPLEKFRKDGRKYFRKAHTFNPNPKQGYPAINLPGGAVCVHTLVANAFLGERPSDARTVNHKDGNKHNNHYTNLEWASYAENNRHARRTGLNIQHGENCNLTKFSDDIVDAIRILNNSKRFTQIEIGQFFNMSVTHVNEIVNMRSRKNISVHTDQMLGRNS